MFYGHELGLLACSSSGSGVILAPKPGQLPLATAY